MAVPGKTRSFGLSPAQEEALKGIRETEGLSMAQIIDEALSSYLYHEYGREWPAIARHIPQETRPRRAPHRGHLVIESIFLSDAQDRLIRDLHAERGEPYGFFSALIEEALAAYIPARFNMPDWPTTTRAMA